MLPDPQRLIDTAMLVWGCIFCLIMSFCLFLSKNYNRERRKWMLSMQLATAVLLGGDTLSWIFNGSPGNLGFFMVRISNFCVFVMNDLILLFFQQYVGCHLFGEERKKNKWIRIASGIAVLALALVVVSQFTGLYYYFDAENVYHRNPGYMIALVLPLAGMIIDLVLLLRYRKKLTREIFFALSSYIVFPSVAALIQTVHYGISLMDVSVGCSMILMYITAASEQNKELERISKSREEIAEQLQISSVLNRCVKELSSDKDENQAISNLLEIVNGYFDADRTYIFEIDSEKNVMYNTYEYVKGMVTEQIDNLQGISLDIISIWMEKFKQSKAYFIPDLELEKETPHYEILKMQDITSLLVVPLINAGVVTGFFGVDNPKEHYEDATLLSFIQFFISCSLERKKEKEYLKYLSYRDMLTNLYNRNRYIELLDVYKKRKAVCTGVAYIDLNGLKQINDQKGHEAGDEHIRAAAAIIAEIFPEQAYRIGGDEFVVISCEIQNQEFSDRMKLLRERMNAADISISAGSVWKEEIDDLNAVLKTADMEMYQEKEEYHRVNGSYYRR